MEEFSNMFSQVRNELENLNKGLRKKTFEAVDSNNLIKITVNGIQEIKKVDVDPSLIKPGSEAVLEEALREAVTQLTIKSKQFLKQEMSKLMNEFQFPDIF